jgi:hypothetical protein
VKSGRVARGEGLRDVKTEIVESGRVARRENLQK